MYLLNSHRHGCVSFIVFKTYVCMYLHTKQTNVDAEHMKELNLHKTPFVRCNWKQNGERKIKKKYIITLFTKQQRQRIRSIPTTEKNFMIFFLCWVRCLVCYLFISACISFIFFAFFALVRRLLYCVSRYDIFKNYITWIVLFTFDFVVCAVHLPN